jgi:hypothetical protein
VKIEEKKRKHKTNKPPRREKKTKSGDKRRGQ